MTNITTFDALGDTTRRSLFELLRQGPRSVNELASAMPVSQPAVSQHLKVLKEASLVRVQVHGSQRIYSIDPAGLANLRSYVDSLWDDVLAAYLQAADNLTQEEPDGTT